MMRQKLVVGALLTFALLMAALEHVASRHPIAEPPPGVATEKPEDAGISASPLLTR